MYETNPKFCLGFVAVLLIAAFVLPAVMVFPSVGQTAAGVQIALMLLVLWVIRLILLPNPSSWLDMVRFPLALFASVAALNFSPQDGVMDVVTNYSFVPMLVGAAIGIAFMSRRPKPLGFSINRDFWLVLITVGFLVAWNHFYLLPQAQGAAVVADLVVIAALANWVAFGQAPSKSDLGRRALNVLSWSLLMGSFIWMVRALADGSFDAVTSVIIVAVQFPIFWLFYPSMERHMLER